AIRVPVEVLRRLPFGVPTRAAQMFEERERFAGVRPYEPGDPLNRIHWRLTAHAGELQTKLFEPTRSADVLLALDLAMGEPFWDAVFPEIAEDTIGWATFLARRAISLGWRVGLVANTHARRGRGPLRVPASAVKGHEGVLFAALARMPNEPTSDLAPVLRELGKPLTRGTVAVVLTPRPGRRLQAEIAGLRHRGVQVAQLSPVEARLAKAGAVGHAGPGAVPGTILVALAVGLRAVMLALRDWRDPIGLSILMGALAALILIGLGGAAGGVWRSLLPIVVLVFFVGSLASRAASVRLEDIQPGPEASTLDGDAGRRVPATWGDAVLAVLVVLTGLLAVLALTGGGDVLRAAVGLLLGVLITATAWLLVVL